MKKYNYKNWTLILLLVLLAHSLSWILYVKIFSAGSLQRQKMTLMEKPGNKSAKIWIMGDSHPMLGLNPDFIPESFNLASTSEYYFLTELKLNQLLSKGQKPEILILPFDPHSFSAQGNALLLGHELDDYFWSGILSPEKIRNKNLPSSYLRWWIGATFFPYAGQFFSLAAWKKTRPFKLEENGFAPSEENFSAVGKQSTELQAKVRFNSHFSGHSPYDHLQFSSLKSILKECSKNRIQVVLVSYPLSDDYRNLVEMSGMEDQLQLTFQKIKKPPIRLNYASFFKDKSEYFSDADHLNKKGAAILSQKIRIELDSLRKTPAAKPQGT
jgi:hypothetical protein